MLYIWAHLVSPKFRVKKFKCMNENLVRQDAVNLKGTILFWLLNRSNRRLCFGVNLLGKTVASCSIIPHVTSSGNQTHASWTFDTKSVMLYPLSHVVIWLTFFPLTAFVFDTYRTVPLSLLVHAPTSECAPLLKYRHVDV